MRFATWKQQRQGDQQQAKGDQLHSKLGNDAIVYAHMGQQLDGSSFRLRTQASGRGEWEAKFQTPLGPRILFMARCEVKTKRKWDERGA
jgi:hypothetical protein